MAIYRDEQGNIISRKSPVTGKSKRSEAQKKADKIYRTKQLSNGKNKQINATVSIGDYLQLDNYCKSMGMSKASTIVNAIKYCVEHKINLKEWSTNIDAQDDTE